MAKAKTTHGNLPHRLAANANLCFQGPEFIESGFFIGDRTHKSLLVETKKSYEVLSAVCDSEWWNETPETILRRWIIDFQDWPLERAEKYFRSLRILEKHVKPARLSSSRERDRRYWWQIAERRPALHDRASGLRRVIVIPQASHTPVFLFVGQGFFFYDVAVICDESFGRLAVLQSAIHEAWIRAFGCAASASARYTPEQCFETFPFCPDESQSREMGQAFNERRNAIINSQREGVNSTYSRIHDPKESSPNIQALRDNHVILDRLVASEYGWGDLDLAHDFHKTPQGVRYAISESARHEVLSRLLKLNHKRFAREVEQGLHNKKKAKSTKATTGKKRK